MWIRSIEHNCSKGDVMKQNKIAITYDFDGTLTPKSMQEYTLLPKLGIKSKSFWELIVKEARETGGESMMIYMRQILDHARNRNVKISKNEFLRMGKEIKYYNGVPDWYRKHEKYVKKLTGGNVELYDYIISAMHMAVLEGV